MYARHIYFRNNYFFNESYMFHLEGGMTHNKHWGMYEGLSQVTNANIDRFDLFLNLELRYFVWVLGGYCDFVCRLEEKKHWGLSRVVCIAWLL